MTTFVHLDDVSDSPHESGRFSGFNEEPNANSTFINEEEQRSPRKATFLNKSFPGSAPHLSSSHLYMHSDHPGNDGSYSVGHTSHLPRPPPRPATYTIPSIVNNKLVGTDISTDEDLFGMIKLKETDVCYTSGTIEWVGRKRSLPLNSGFKILNDCQRSMMTEPVLKKMKLNKTFTSGVDKLKECDCADVLPTVNAIVDHLNALHEAVDLVDLRLNTLEDALSK